MNPIAIIFALAEELRPLLKEQALETRVTKRKTTISKGIFRGVPILFCRTGMGMGNAHQGSEELIDRSHPSLIFSVGYCGGLKEGIASGDLILPDEVRSESNDRFRPDASCLKSLSDIIDEGGARCHRGPLLTTFHPLQTTERKREAGEKGAIAVDLETAAIAAVSEKKGVPWVSLRIVFDPVEFHLKGLDPLSVLKHGLLQAPRLAWMHYRCRKRLSEFALKAIERLSASLPTRAPVDRSRAKF